MRHQGCPSTRKGHEDAGRRRPSASLGESPHQKPTLLAPWSWTSSPQNCERIAFCCLSRPVYGILLGQPKRTNTKSVLQGTTGGTEEQRHIARHTEGSPQDSGAQLYLLCKTVTAFIMMVAKEMDGRREKGALRWSKNGSHPGRFGLQCSGDF